MAKKIWQTARSWKTHGRTPSQLQRAHELLEGVANLTTSELVAAIDIFDETDVWDKVMDGNVLDVAHLKAQVAAAIPPRTDLSAEDVDQASTALVQGLLDYALHEIDEIEFHRVVAQRLHRIETRASRVDRVVLGLNEYLLHRVDVSSQQHRSTIGHLRRAIARLPPPPARRSLVLRYLDALVGALNVDPWTRVSYGLQELTPSKLERTLLLEGSNGDQLRRSSLRVARSATRLVVRGGPGAGKTWLAKRIARDIAERSSAALRGGQSVGGIEIPIFATCASVARSGGAPRMAVIDAAMNLMPDLGGETATEAVRRLFQERSSGVVVILDSLDEAGEMTPDLLERIASIGSWRFVLTSRPSYWSDQVSLDGSDPRHVVADLLPLTYPDDVETVIDNWHSQDAALARRLKEDLSQRADLQTAATVPLILAFFCIVASEGEFPRFRQDLVRKVIRRLLAGPWRSPVTSGVDRQRCEEILTEWAWAAAAGSPGTRNNGFSDSFRAAPTPLLPDKVQAGVDNICPIVGRTDPDYDEGERRFVHRVLHEHLVAEKLASLNESDATEVILRTRGIRDWAYAASAGLARHPDRSAIVRHLLSAVTGTDFGDANCVITARCLSEDADIERLILRAAAESDETDWYDLRPAVEGLRLKAAGDSWWSDGNQRELAGLGLAHWESSNKAITESILLQSADDLWRRLDVNFLRIAVEDPAIRQILNDFALSDRDTDQTGPVLAVLMESEQNEPARAGLIRWVFRALENEERSTSRDLPLLQVLASAGLDGVDLRHLQSLALDRFLNSSVEDDSGYPKVDYLDIIQQHGPYQSFGSAIDDGPSEIVRVVSEPAEVISRCSPTDRLARLDFVRRTLWNLDVFDELYKGRDLIEYVEAEGLAEETVDIFVHEIVSLMAGVDDEWALSELTMLLSRVGILDSQRDAIRSMLLRSLRFGGLEFVDNLLDAIRAVQHGLIGTGQIRMLERRIRQDSSNNWDDHWLAWQVEDYAASFPAEEPEWSRVLSVLYERLGSRYYPEASS